jgi:hypothetical protein
MVKRLLITLVCLIIVGILAVVFITGYVWVHYGDHHIVSSDIHISQTEGFTKYVAPNARSSAEGVILFPANFVSPEQYSQLAHDITLISRQPVYVARPKLRIEPWGIDIQTVHEHNPTIKTWTYIGHSAGAAAACRASLDNRLPKPHQVIIIAGYCNKSGGPSSVHSLARDDPWVNYGKHREDGHQMHTVYSGDHFFITNAYASPSIYNEALKLILHYVKN